MLGKRSKHAEECFKDTFIGADYEIYQDLTNELPDNWREFNQKFIPVYLKTWPEKSKIAAGLACGVVWSVAKGIKRGDIVICPNGSGSYRVGEVIGDYYYAADQILPHRRKVQWYPKLIERAAFSEPLKNSTGSIGTLSNITKYATEIEQLIAGNTPPKLFSTDESVEDTSSFALEEHLEHFLVTNWASTEFGKEYDIFVEDGETVGQQYQTDTGPLDILAISKDKTRLLVLELKKGRASDTVVGQTLRYMSYVQEELAEEGQTVHGVIIAHEDDQKIRRALAMTRNIVFYRYQVSFKLVKA